MGQTNKRMIGAIGEDIAEKYLKKHGYKILERNFHASRLAEIDIIAREKETLVFIEVKFRSSQRFGRACEAVTPKKQHNIRLAAQAYIMLKHNFDVPVRFDVVEINGKEITLIKNAF